MVIFWIVVPAIHYSNTWYSQYLPISSTGSFDRFQQTYNVSKLSTIKLYHSMKRNTKSTPFVLSTTFAISYGLSFASILATITHTICFHGRDLIASLKAKEKPDVHNRLMKAYKPVPEWWYLVVFLVFLVCP